MFAQVAFGPLAGHLSALVAELLPELKTVLDLVGPIVCHVNTQVTEQQKADDWKLGGGDEDEEPA